MDNFREKEQSSEPRIGVAPFEHWDERQVQDDGDFVNISSKKISLGGLGDLTLTLQQPSKGNLEEATEENDQAFTIDLSGNIHKGNLRSFLMQGYFMLYLEIDSKLKPIPQDKVQLLKANLWINNTTPTVSYELELEDPWYGVYKAFFNREVQPEESKRGIYEHFVLPDNPEILQAVRINVISQSQQKIP